MLDFDKIYCGDNCDLLGRLPRECIDLVVTSPPYDDLRAYGGHSWDFFGVAWQLQRVLKPGGVIVWVVAETTTAPDVLQYRYIQPCIDASGALCPGEWTEWKPVPVHVLPPNGPSNRPAACGRSG